MATAVIMPKFSMTQEKARVISWLVAEGESVEKGDPLMEVETDKVTMEVEAPADGVLRGIRVAEGDVVPVTETIGYIVAAGEAWSAGTATDGAAASPPAGPRVTPVARRVAAAAGLDLENIPPPDGGRTIRRHHVEQYLHASVQPDGEGLRSGDGQIRATPAARRLARELHLDLAQIPGNGPYGRIQGTDVTAYHRRPAMSTAASSPSTKNSELRPLSAMRRTIADRLVKSYQAIPHTTFTVTAEMSATLDLGQRLRARAEKEGIVAPSVTAILVKVCAWALGKHPMVNASWSEEGIQLHEQADIGVAVALDDGLIVPVLHDAAGTGLASIAGQLHELTERARSGRLTPADVQGGTFTISNLGMLGIDHFTAIINPPQSAILAVGRIAKQPLVVETAAGEELAIRPLMHLTLSVDHRVIDGAVAARFLQDVVAGLARPDELLW